MGCGCAGGAAWDLSSNSAPEPAVRSAHAHTHEDCGAGGGGARSQDTLLRIAVPFRNNPVLKYNKKGSSFEEKRPGALGKKQFQ